MLVRIVIHAVGRSGTVVTEGPELAQSLPAIPGRSQVQSIDSSPFPAGAYPCIRLDSRRLP